MHTITTITDKIYIMGRGDKKTAKGKRAMGSYGNSRKKNEATVVAPKAKKTVKVKETAATEKKVAVKKPAVKKVAAEKVAVVKVAAEKKPAAKKATKKTEE